MITASTHTYWVLCDHVLAPDGRSFQARRIKVERGRFSQVEELRPGSQPPGPEPLWDLRGFRLLPPLVDTHVHLHFAPWPLAPQARPQPPTTCSEAELESARLRMREAFQAGVGILRDLGDPLGINLLAQQSAHASSGLPRLQVSGAGLFREGRYGRFIGTGIQTTAEFLDAVRQAARDPRLAVVKLVPTGIINFKKGAVTVPPQFSGEELHAAVALAHELGKPVAAHASGDEGIRLAVEAGVDFIEHGYFMSRETLERLAAKGLAWTPTFAPVHAQWLHASLCGWSPDVRAKLRKILDDHALLLRQARELGVEVLAGSDAGGQGVGHGGGLWQELWLLAEAGLSAPEVLALATRRATDRLGLGDRFGRIEAGRAADFIVVEGALERDLRALESLRFVARDGVVLPARRPRLVEDREAASYDLPAAADAAPTAWAC